MVIRPVITERAMTAMPADLPTALVKELVAEMLAIDGVTALALGGPGAHGWREEGMGVKGTYTHPASLRANDAVAVQEHGCVFCGWV